MRLPTFCRNRPPAHRAAIARAAAARAAAALVLVALAACVAPPPVAPAPSPPPTVVLPPVPWRDGGDLAVQRGDWQWTDASRGRAISAQWAVPAAPARALLIVLPGLARGTDVPAVLMDTLASGGLAVVALGHAGNDDSFGQTAAKGADAKLAARRMHAMAELAERGTDVRHVLATIAREPPPWLKLDAAYRVGLVGIDLGAQTAQWLVGERMTRDAAAAVPPRVDAAALIGPYVGFDGPALHQRYLHITVPLLVIFGTRETDPHGLGMTAAQRRAMVGELTNARVTEVRTPTSVVTLLYPPPSRAGAADTATGPGPASAPRDPSNRTGRGGGSPQSRPQGDGPPGGGPPAGGDSPAPVNSAAERATLIATLLSLRAFFEAELLGNGEAREWLEGRHAGPALWATLPAGRPSTRP